jgi:hypothetical protein
MTPSVAARAGVGLGLDLGVGLPVIGAPLAVADDDEAGAGVLEHGGGHVAGVRAAIGWHGNPGRQRRSALASLRVAWISVKGGASATSTFIRRSAARSIARASDSIARVPCIFQLPTM